jgi:hypothetical protein
MDAFWLTAYLSLSGAVLVFSLLLALLTWEHRRFVRSCLRAAEHHRPTGRVALFAPCKGLDLDIEANLRAILDQDYDDFEVAFIVESTDDPVYPAIRRAMAEHPSVPTRVIVAGRAFDSGQKVHNLRVATEHLAPRIKYLAFVDSDACPRPAWLRAMVARLNDPVWSAVTGYRWFVPKRATLANALVYSMNCDVISLLTKSSHTLIWGGSWAISREVFDAIELHKAWQGTLSDDLVASRLMRQHGLKVRFEPACVVGSPLDESLRQAMSFIRRQYLVARFYTFDWWLLSLLAATGTNAIWLGNLAVFAWSLLSGRPSPWIPLAVSAVLYAVTVYRGWLRQDLVRAYFAHQEKALRRIRWFDIWANPLVELAHWLGIAISAAGRHILWRGIRYHVLPGGRVEQILRLYIPDEPIEAAKLLDAPAEKPVYRKAA